MESTVKGWLSLFTAATFYPRKRGRKRVSRGGLWLSAGIWKKGGPGGWQIRRTHSDQSPRKENEGRYRKGFRGASARNIKVRAISSARIQMKRSTYWRLYRFLVDTYQFAREILLFDKKEKKKKERKGKRKDCCVPRMNKNCTLQKLNFRRGACKILSVWLLLFYFNLIWRKKL